MEWVEIIEPSSRNIMYANLTTGQCVWEPPPQVAVKKFDDNQWWELFDSNTSRFYYYNATTQKTVWHKPQNCDIIPLAKLQQIKQNTEVSEGIDGLRSAKESIGTQTPSKANAQHGSPACTGSGHTRNGCLPSSAHLNHHARPPDHRGGIPKGGQPQQRVKMGWREGSSSPHEPLPWSLQRLGDTPPLSRGLHRSMTSSMTQTSPAPSPRPTRRASHHHHHHNHSNRHGCPHRHLDSGGETPEGVGRRTRRSSQSSQSSAVSCSKPIRDSGRLSDSSMSQSRTSLEGCTKVLDPSLGLRDSQRGRTRSAIGTRMDHKGALISPSSQQLVSPSTPSGQRRTPTHTHDHSQAHAFMAKQRSFDVANYAPKRSDFLVERPREMALSRSYSFMSRPKCYDDEPVVDRCFGAGGMRSVESTPQPRRRHRGLDGLASSPDASLASHGALNHRQKSDSSGLDSLATPMTHRKQRSLEGVRATIPSDDQQTSSSTTPHARVIPSSDSSGSPPSPRRDLTPFAPFFALESPRCPDSGASTLTDRETRSQHGRGSADSSPHSQVDSGLVSGTTGSRGSADSSIKRTVSARHYHAPAAGMEREAQVCRLATDKEARKCGHHRRHHCAKHRPTTATATAHATTDSDRSDTLQSSSSSLQMIQSSSNSQNHNSSSASSTTAKQSSPKNSNSKQESPVDSGSSTSKQQSPNIAAGEKQGLSNVQHRDITHLYSNLDYVYDQPVYQFIMEQAKLSGYRFADRLYDDADSLHSDDSGGRHGDSDEFADDEGMSNADSSSQEYLDDVNYLPDDETYTQFFMPSHLKNRQSDMQNKDHSSEPPARETHHPPVGLLTTLGSGGDYSNVPSSAHFQRTSALPSSPYQQNTYSNVPYELQHASLRRKKEPAPQPPRYSPIQEKVPFSVMKKPLSETDFERLSLTSGGDTPSGSNMMEKYAQENLNVHTRGLLRKKVPVIDMISWTKDPIRKPMLATVDKALKNQACELFKLVQIYMSDRKPKPDMTLNSVGLEIVLLAYNNAGLRDELYVQVCRQTTENHKRDSLRRGWELMAICLEFFPPSEKFLNYLSGYIAKHCDPAYQTMYPEISKWPIHIQINHYAGVCSKRLERTTVNAKRQRLKKPNLEEIDLARLHIFRASMFGGTLEEVMALQRDSGSLDVAGGLACVNEPVGCAVKDFVQLGGRYPHRRLPWVQTTLSEEVLRLQGTSTEGIFRVPADFDEVNHLKQVVDQWEVGECGDSHVVAALLKLWYRELYQPLIPDSLYGPAIEACECPPKAVALVNQLPEINRLVLAYLIRFLQYFSQAEIVVATKMDANNLAMVMAPNCLRCTSDDPKVIYENTRKEMAFIRTLIQHLDTTFMEGIV